MVKNFNLINKIIENVEYNNGEEKELVECELIKVEIKDYYRQFNGSTTNNLNELNTDDKNLVKLFNDDFFQTEV
jgi:hypothetical protein